MAIRMFLGLVALIASSAATAEVVRVELLERSEWVGGRNFAVGKYERLVGTVFYEIDPNSAAAKDVADIQLAPRNAQGKVEYSGPFLILRPMDPFKANGTTLVEIANRGGVQTNGSFYQASPMALINNQTNDISYAGVFDRGYTVAWVGWQADLDSKAFGLTVPRANVSGMARATTFLNYRGSSSESGAASFGGACALDANDASAELRMLKRYDEVGVLIPRDQWSFAKRAADGVLKPDPCVFTLNKPVDGKVMASLRYKAQPPLVTGLGQAAVRDFISHLKHADIKSPINTRINDAKHIIGFGSSQSARFLRDFIYRGFNADTRGRKVFDGTIEYVAGAGRGSFNHRYASPGEAGNSVGSALRAVDLYPFADLPTPDIDGKGRLGLLDRANKSEVTPKIFRLFSSSEYWARAASLTHVTPDGKRALPEASNTRTYFFAGTSHSPRPSALFLASSGPAPLPYNDNRDMNLALPALLEAMRLWIAQGREPPASRRPAIGAELVEPSKLHFPNIWKAQSPMSPPPVWKIDFGPDYAKKHVIAEPPRLGPRYNLLVPQVDTDGNEIGGWHGLLSSVPLGTYTAWNVENGQSDSFGLLSGLDGAFIPFSTNRAERERSGDSRPSIVERYGGKDGYIKKIEVVINEQISAGFLLPEDRERAMEIAVIAWDRASIARALWVPPPVKQ
jgi:hypothetical protein